MKTHLINRWDAVRDSFWFIPAVMSTGAMLLALVCTSLNGPLAESLVNAVPWIGVSTDAARASLTSIGGAMVSIAGIVFSVMLVTLSITSSQYGSRLLRTFMADSVTQCALGMLVGTSLFCMMSLAGIQSADGDRSSVNVSVIAGLFLAIASLAVLVAFIHHVANLIQAPNVVAAVAADLNASFDRLFPEQIGGVKQSQAPGKEIKLPEDGCGSFVASTKEGYLQAVDADSLLAISKKDDLFMRLKVKPGQFVECSQALVEIWPSESVVTDYKRSTTSAARSDFGDTFRREINDTIITGRRRTPRQDAECALEELVEIALRALSPGINDPFTAISCLDYLGATLGRAAEREMPSRIRYDEDGVPRIEADATTFANLMDTAFNPVRQHGCKCVAVAIRMLQALGRIAEHVSCKKRQAIILGHAEKLKRDFRKLVDQPDDGDDFQKAYEQLVRELDRLTIG